MVRRNYGGEAALECADAVSALLKERHRGCRTPKRCAPGNGGLKDVAIEIEARSPTKIGNEPKK